MNAASWKLNWTISGKPAFMRTMMELLTRLLQLRCCCERIGNNEHLTKGEENSTVLFKRLVRECLPAEVLAHYDRLKRTEPELLECPHKQRVPFIR